MYLKTRKNRFTKALPLYKHLHRRERIVSDIGQVTISCAPAPADTSPWLTFDEANACCASYGDSFYVFHKNVFRNNFAALKSAFDKWYPHTTIAYSYKTNYTPAVCSLVTALGGYAEVVSEMEFDLACRLGVRGPQIIYNGPCKSLESIQKALQCGALLNVDSVQDYTKSRAIAATLHGREAVIGIRCNFFMEGREPSRFGVEVDSDEFVNVVKGIRSTRNLRLGGLHCHFPDRDLESFQQRTSKLLEIVKRVFPDGPLFIDIGGGFFGDLPNSLRKLYTERPPTFSEYGEVVGRLCTAAFSGMASPPTLFIEPGTALVANAFRFYTRVLDVRNVGSRRIATVAGSIQNISPHARSCQLPVKVLTPVLTTPDPYATEQAIDIAGYTCMEGDYLTKELRTRVTVGDVLEYGNVGSYSIVMKPPFIMPNVPILMIADDPRAMFLIRRKEDPKSMFHSFVVAD